jgi:hypothetical protein
LTADTFVPSDNKNIVRSKWCTPILESLRDVTKSNYFYLGLPGPKIADLIEWKDMIERICAFECPDRNGDQTKSWTEMDFNLLKVFAPRGVVPQVFFGHMEYILEYMKDYNSKEFSQEALVTLYQLDFCQALTSWTSKKVAANHKYNAIRHLLSIQRQFVRTNGEKPFIIFLTVRNEFHKGALKDLLENPSSEYDMAVQSMLDDVPIVPKRHLQVCHPLLKIHVYDTLRLYMRGRGVRSIFLPPIYYMGGKKSTTPMAVFTILASFDLPHLSSPKVVQTSDEFLCMQGYELKGDDLVPSRKCSIENQCSGDYRNAIDNYIKLFVSDPVWESLPSAYKELAAEGQRYMTPC